MLWGLKVEPSKSYSQKVIQPFHLSQAVLDINIPTANSHSDVQLILSRVNCENGDNIVTEDFILCVLKRSRTVQVPLNLIFSEGDDITFRSVGGTVQLIGYSLDERSDEDETYDSRHTERRRISQESGDSEGGSGDEGDGSDDEVATEAEDGSDDEEGAEVKVENDSDNDLMEEEQPIPPPAKRPKYNGNSNINEPKKAQKPKVVKNKIRRHDGDIIIEDIRKGKGTVVKSGNKVEIYFDGRLESNGNKSVGKLNVGKGYTFTVGKGEVIRGWDIGIVGMKVGGKRKIICPPGKAYGPRSYQKGIPQNATLVYEIELRNIL
ncbi:39 kDa FK506-binding nuclear protein-like [Bradysia coprophila]|uniref:39 kDa FK506-binding nuclear protein-like n=1 Tax=Bradysia coprophila TaxID=38358 RepID=UPI00187D7E7C|nr:39 kDa FK506-binding nuclear protein-like [Bradysia coprophila]